MYTGLDRCGTNASCSCPLSALPQELSDSITLIVQFSPLHSKQKAVADGDLLSILPLLHSLERWATGGAGLPVRVLGQRSRSYGQDLFRVRTG